MINVDHLPIKKKNVSIEQISLRPRGSTKVWRTESRESSVHGVIDLLVHSHAIVQLLIVQVTTQYQTGRPLRYSYKGKIKIP